MWFFLRMQLVFAVVFATLILLLKGASPGLSALAGGLVALTGGVIYVAILRKESNANPAAILHLHFAAEIAKLLGMSLAVVVLYLWYRQVEWFWVVSGCLAAYSAYWFGLLIKN